MEDIDKHKLIIKIDGIQKEETFLTPKELRKKLISMGRTKQYEWIECSDSELDVLEIHITKGVEEKFQKCFERNPIEYIQCPYCGSKLNRVGNKKLIPTSCMHCNKHNINTSIKYAYIVDN